MTRCWRGFAPRSPTFPPARTRSCRAPTASGAPPRRGSSSSASPSAWPTTARAVELTADPAAAAGAALAAAGARRVVVAPDLPDGLRPRGVELVEDRGLSPVELDALDGVLTTCAVACADTGSIALDGGPGQGRRAISLVPDLHVCIVRADQIVETVPELVEALAAAARAGRPILIVSGPSATSDIELNRVEGVHGPRTLVVVIDAP